MGYGHTQWAVALNSGRGLFGSGKRLGGATIAGAFIGALTGMVVGSFVEKAVAAYEAQRLHSAVGGWRGSKIDVHQDPDWHGASERHRRCRPPLDGSPHVTGSTSQQSEAGPGCSSIHLTTWRRAGSAVLWSATWHITRARGTSRASVQTRVRIVNGFRARFDLCKEDLFATASQRRHRAHRHYRTSLQSVPYRRIMKLWTTGGRFPVGPPWPFDHDANLGDFE